MTIVALRICFHWVSASANFLVFVCILWLCLGVLSTLICLCSWKQWYWQIYTSHNNESRSWVPVWAACCVWHPPLLHKRSVLVVCAMCAAGHGEVHNACYLHHSASIMNVAWVHMSTHVICASCLLHEYPRWASRLKGVWLHTNHYITGTCDSCMKTWELHGASMHVMSLLSKSQSHVPATQSFT